MPIRTDLERVRPAAAAGPEAWMEAIRTLVGKQDLKGAKQIADEAAALFPDHPEIQKAHHVFRPYKSSLSSVREPDRSRAFARLKELAPELRGRWVALSEDDVVASAENLKELLVIVQPMKVEFRPLVEFIEEAPEFQSGAEVPMTRLLEEAVEKARELPPAEQDAIAAIILEEIAGKPDLWAVIQKSRSENDLSDI